jgi:hypothetical protein
VIDIHVFIRRRENFHHQFRRAEEDLFPLLSEPLTVYKRNVRPSDSVGSV